MIRFRALFIQDGFRRYGMEAELIGIRNAHALIPECGDRAVHDVKRAGAGAVVGIGVKISHEARRTQAKPPAPPCMSTICGAVRADMRPYFDAYARGR